MKVGTSALTAGTRRLDNTRVSRLADQIAALRRDGAQVILVTSGAIGVGMGRLGLERRPSSIGDLQAVAAVGQNLLMHTYEATFRKLNVPVAQALITAGDLADRGRYVNFSNALNSLFRFGVLPIVNENDSIATDEIKVGDNDTLSAHVANAVEADLLVILTNTDGVYTADPHRFPDAARIPIIERITPELMRLAEEPARKGDRAQLGTGRLYTKLRAAEIVTSSGIPMALADAARERVLHDVLRGDDVGAFFVPTGIRKARRKRWIAHALIPKGTLVTDDGAQRAVLERGASLLPAGVRDVEGDFKLGDAVRCVGQDGAEYARGLVNYTSEEVARICGRSADAIAGILGYHYADEVIHRDNLVLLKTCS